MKLAMLSYDPPVWAVESTFAEKDVVKKAGAWWHPGKPCERQRTCLACRAGIGKSWWTKDPKVAAALSAESPAHVREIIQAILEKKAQSVAASVATDADIEIPIPPGLALLPFQKAGVAYARHRTGTLIGDEMGLGKTVQAIALTNLWEDVHRALVVCPAFLRINWEREFRRWSTRDLSIGIVDRMVWPSLRPDADLTTVIINYDIIGRHDLSGTWDLVIMDEAHYIKNPDAQRTKTALGINAKRRLYLTGTPILNRPRELWTLVNSLSPKSFPSKKGFLFRYCGPEQVWVPGRGMITKFDGASHLDELQEKLREHVMVRRLKKDVLAELPAKRRSIVPLTPNGAGELVEREAEIWEQKQDALDEIKARIASARAEHDEDLYRIAVADLRAAEEIAFEEMATIRHEIALEKVPQVIDYANEMLQDVDKLVVFCHHKDVAAALAGGLVAYSPVLSTGDMTAAERQESVDLFQENPGTRVFIGTIMSSGVGITLTSASNVIFSELSFRPADITQAEDRLHRIGQHDSVNVYHLVFDESLDAKMAKMIIEKQEIAKKALDKGLSVDATLPPPVEAKPAPTREPAEAHDLSPETVAAVHYALRGLAGMCDGARTKDGVGFNRHDAMFGKELAGRSALTQRQAQAAKRMVKKYHSQLEPEIILAIWPDWKER